MKRMETDIHLHLDGSLSADVVRILAGRIGYDLEGRDLKKLLQVGGECASLEEYLSCFELPSILLQTEEGLKLAACCLVRRLADQGVVYGEIRFAPQLHRYRGMTQEQAVEAVVRGVEEGSRNRGIYVGVLLCAMVNGSDGDNQETMELSRACLGKGVVGADIAGPEGLVPMKHFEGMFRRLYQAGVPFTIHAGECGDYENVALAVSYGARRIGHGCAAVKSETCMELLKREKVTLEMCVVSNLQTKAAESIKTHPLKEFYNRGIRVTYNTDDMTVSGTDLEREARLITGSMGLTERDLLNMNVMAVEAGFAAEEVRRPILEQMRAQP